MATQKSKPTKPSLKAKAQKARVKKTAKSGSVTKKPATPKSRAKAAAKPASPAKKPTPPKPQVKKPVKPKASAKKSSKPAVEEASVAEQKRDAPLKENSVLKLNRRSKPKQKKPEGVARKATAERTKEGVKEPSVKPDIARSVVDAGAMSPAQRVPIDKNLYEKPAEEIDVPWRLPGDDEDTGRNYRRMLRTLLVAALLLGIFNSGALFSWVRGLPAGTIEAGIIVSSETWHHWMEEAGVSDYIVRIREQIQSLKNADW